jgi:thiosulfate reductase cytochrome b subunit
MQDARTSKHPTPDRVLIERHSIITRLTHWVNVFCLAILLMSGLQIFNAHPALYWGDASDFAHPLAALGRFPGWLTIPTYQDLAGGRLWHFFFAWIFAVNATAYLCGSILSRHFTRDLVPTLAELKRIGRSAREHLRLRFPKGEEARRYNVIQQMAYLAVILGLLPLMILTGLSMSPQIDADFHWLPALFGGRQSARTLHFAVASALVAFTFVHLLMVLLSGAWNNLRSMITGRYAIDSEERDASTDPH